MGESAAAKFYEGLTDPSQLSPRVRMALRMYVNAAVPTLKDAAIAVGITPQYLSNINGTVAAKKYTQTAHEIIEEKAHDVNALIASLSHRAVQVIGQLMEDGSSENIRLRAAQDLADRGPETSKIQKHQVESFSLSSDDARGIAEAMVAAATLRQRHEELRVADFDMTGAFASDDNTPVVIPPSLQEP